MERPAGKSIKAQREKEHRRDQWRSPQEFGAHQHQGKGEEDKRKAKMDICADPDSVAFIAKTVECKVLATTIHQLDAFVVRIRAQAGRGIPMEKADAIIKKVLAATLAVDTVTRQAAKLATMRYYAENELRFMQQTAKIELVDKPIQSVPTAPAKKEQKAKGNGAEKAPAPPKAARVDTGAEPQAAAAAPAPA